MNGTCNLKLFVSISMGFHFFLFSLLSVLFPDFKITPLPSLHIEVSLLPLPMEKKEPLKKGDSRERVRIWPAPIEASGDRKVGVRSAEEFFKKQETEVKNESLPVDPDAKMISPIEKVEVSFPKKEEQPITFPFGQSGNRVVSSSEPKSPSFESEKKETEVKQEERLMVASLGNPVPQTSPSEPFQTAMKGPALSNQEIVLAQPRYAESPKLLYPKEAKRKGYEGEVLLRVEVLSNGRVGSIELKRSSGYDLLDRSAVAAVKQWKFIPAKKGETPVTAWVHIPISFQLR